MDGVSERAHDEVSNSKPRPMVVPRSDHHSQSLNTNNDMVSANTMPAAVTTPRYSAMARIIPVFNPAPISFFQPGNQQQIGSRIPPPEQGSPTSPTPSSTTRYPECPARPIRVRKSAHGKLPTVPTMNHCATTSSGDDHHDDQNRLSPPLRRSADRIWRPLEYP